MSILRASASLLVGAALLSGCGGRIYNPAASSLGKSVEVMVPVINSDLADYPNELRAALLDNAPDADIRAMQRNPSDLLCRPVRSGVELAAYSNKLQSASDSLIKVSGESPKDFSDLAAATLSKYAVSSGDVDPLAVGAEARQSCYNDFKYDTALANFLGTAGAEAGFAAAFAGLTELWGLLKPVATGVLSFVDQQRREQAIVAFLRTDGPKLKSYVDKMSEFSGRKAAWERAVAAKAFAQEVAKLTPGAITDDQKKAVLDAAATYDALRAVDPTTSYKAVSASLDRLIGVSNGKYSEADLSAAISGFGESFSALQQISENIAALQKGGDKNEALRAAIAKIRGKEPKTEASANPSD
jgi:hypothetical protein